MDKKDERDNRVQIKTHTTKNKETNEKHIELAPTIDLGIKDGRERSLR